MPPRNPSELARLEAEREDLLTKIKNPSVGKSSKEALLRELRSVERTLGISGQPYNSSAFGGSDGDNLR